MTLILRSGSSVSAIWSLPKCTAGGRVAYGSRAPPMAVPRLVGIVAAEAAARRAIAGLMFVARLGAARARANVARRVVETIMASKFAPGHQCLGTLHKIEIIQEYAVNLV